METEIARYTPLKTIVSFFLDQYNKSMNDFDKCWLLAFRGLVSMGFSVTWEPLTVRLEVQGNMTVKLPPDYIAWTKIGILNQSQEVSTLRINNALTKLKDNNPNRLDYLQPNTHDLDFGNLVLNPYYLNLYWGTYYTPLFGLGNGLIQYGDIVVDEKNMVIVVENNFPFSDLILEYISSPEKNGDYQVETCMQEAIIAFIEWKMKLNTEQNYYARLIEGRRSLPGKRITLQTINQAIRSNNGFKIKS